MMGPKAVVQASYGTVGYTTGSTGNVIELDGTEVIGTGQQS
jgi:hypothetical protein